MVYDNFTEVIGISIFKRKFHDLKEFAASYKPCNL